MIRLSCSSRARTSQLINGSEGTSCMGQSSADPRLKVQAKFQPKPSLTRRSAIRSSFFGPMSKINVKMPAHSLGLGPPENALEFPQILNDLPSLRRRIRDALVMTE